MTAGRPIPGFPGYTATLDGQVVSARTGAPLRPSVHWRTGHMRVRLYGRSAPFVVRAAGTSLRTYRFANVYVHVAVALAFHGPPPADGMLVRHLDDDPQNNRPGNLRWGTRSENEQDKHRALDDDGFDWATGHFHTDRSTT